VGSCSPVHRARDMTTGHDCPDGGPCGWAPPTQPASYSTDVLTNNLGTVRHGDTIIPHVCYYCAPCPDPCMCPCPPHSGAYIGLSTVYVNNRPIQVVGSRIDCCFNGTPDDMAATGSPDVIAHLLSAS
jgi:uncharacterized Zn-binding protein involved in type VI secretion